MGGAGRKGRGHVRYRFDGGRMEGGEGGSRVSQHVRHEGSSG